MLNRTDEFDELIERDRTPYWRHGLLALLFDQRKAVAIVTIAFTVGLAVGYEVALFV